jgi:hypothetical protein
LCFIFIPFSAAVPVKRERSRGPGLQLESTIYGEESHKKMERERMEEGREIVKVKHE